MSPNGDFSMKKKRYSEEQIIKAIKEHEAGIKVEDICRDLGISNGTFYNWRSKYAVNRPQFSRHSTAAFRTALHTLPAIAGY